MVHALREIWRVLQPGGSFVDVRPLSGELPLEIVADGQVTLAGFMDDTQTEPDDIACEKALGRIVKEGLFVRQRHETLDYAWYWDTVDEMKAYIEENWDPTPVLPDTVSARARRLLTSGGDGARVRVRANVTIARYGRRAG